MSGGPLAGTNVIPFSTEFVPHTIHQMDACDDPSIRMIVIWEGIRDAKTTACLNAIGRAVTDDPGGIFSVHPTQDDAEKFDADDLEPMIGLALEEYFVAKKSRDSGRTKSFKKFKGGSIRIVSAGSVTKFRGSTVKVLCLHEADALDPESIYKALGRTKGLSDAIIILESTGTTASESGEGGKIVWHSVIAEHHAKGDQQKWWLECAYCHELLWTKYSQFRTPTADKADALWYCDRCGEGHGEREWFKAAQDGLWLPTAGLSEDDQLSIRESHRDARAPQPEVRSYWRNGFNSLFPKSKGYRTKLHEFLAEGESAKSSREALKTWTNEIAAELWNPNPEDCEPPPWKPMYDRRENYGKTVPMRGLFVTCFTDVHDDRLEVFWQAWGRNEESWCMDHTVLQGSVFQNDVWNLLRRELARRFTHENGAEMTLGFGLIDGGDNADRVFWFLGSLRENPEPGVTGKVRASKGVGIHPHPVIHPKFMHVAKNLMGHHIGTWQAKKLFYTERFRMAPLEEFGAWKRGKEDPIWDLWDGSHWIPDPRFGVIHFNREVDQEVFEQFVREKPKLEFVKGDEVMKFEIKSNVRNEGLDFLVGNLAAVRRNRRPWDLFEADLKARAKEAKGLAQPQSKPSKMRRMAGVL